MREWEKKLNNFLQGRPIALKLTEITFFGVFYPKNTFPSDLADFETFEKILDMKIKSYPLHPAKWFFDHKNFLVPDIKKLLTQVYIRIFLRIFSSNVCTCST